MGLTAFFMPMLAESRCEGVDFSRTLTLGRQNRFVRAFEVARALARYDVQPAGEIDRMIKDSPWAEPVFKLLGAEQVDSMDVSDYEGASIVHDLNQPIDSAWSNRYTVVFDGGTLEHVFNFPQALANAMQMVAVGGHFIADTMGENHSGHGFYQFSPELFFRALSPENGFVDCRVTVYELMQDGRRYECVDPDTLGRRVEMVAARQRFGLYVKARRVSETKPFERPPQQSDYSASWQQLDSGRRRTAVDEMPDAADRFAARLRPVAPRLLRWLRRWRDWQRLRPLDVARQPDAFRRKQD